MAASENKKFLKDVESVESIKTSPDLVEPTTLEHNCGAALDFLKPLIKYGQYSTVFSYNIYSSFNGKGLEYFTRRPRIWGIFTGMLYGIMCLHVAVGVVKWDFHVSYSALVNMIKRVTYAIFVVKLITTYYCLHIRGRTKGLWVKIFKQADLLQEQFASFGIVLPSRKKARIVSIGVCIFSAFLTLVHVMVFSFGVCVKTKWYDQYTTKMFNTFTLGYWNSDLLDSIPYVINVVCGIFGLILETISWNLWYYVDSFRVLTALLVWIIFRSLNRALASGKLGVENLSAVMDLHLNGTKLLNLFNQLMGPITLSSSAFNILYVCFWTNYCLIHFDFKLKYIVAIITFVRMLIVFYIVADVNTQAYQISTWMENHFTDMDKIPKKVDKTKFALFTSLIYSREAIGFKGIQFFTCTPALNIAIGGLVLTYTVIVNQVATH